jgi:hypothetical protein
VTAPALEGLTAFCCEWVPAAYEYEKHAKPFLVAALDSQTPTSISKHQQQNNTLLLHELDAPTLFHQAMIYRYKL